MNSARELLQFDFDANAFAHRAPRTIEIPQNNFESLKEISENHGDRGTEMPNREDLCQVYRLFITAHGTERLRTEFGALSRVRKLAWALIYCENQPPFDERIVDNTSQLSDALGLIENRFSISALRGVFDALLQAWDTSNAGMLRTFVKRHLINYDGRRTFVQQLRANMAWYCEENGAAQLAPNLLRLSEVWSHLELPDYVHSYRYFAAVAEAYVGLVTALDRETVADVVEFFEKHKDDKTIRAVLSKLIEKLGINASENLRQPAQSYILREWGDPRITGGAVHWHGASDEARQIFIRWITKEDLRFFFDVVAKACNDQKFAYRKAFWLAYLEHISFCRPVLRRDAEYLFSNDPQTLQYYRERRPATLTGGDSSQHAFIIQIGNYTFVEFSTAGACYVYMISTVPFPWVIQSIRCLSYARGREKHWQPHPGSERYLWQRDFASWLKSNLGLSRYEVIGEPLDEGNFSERRINCPVPALIEALQGFASAPLNVRCTGRSPCSNECWEVKNYLS